MASKPEDAAGRDETPTVRRILGEGVNPVTLPDAVLRAVQVELLSHAIATERVSINMSVSATPEAVLLARVTRESTRRSQAACSFLNRLTKRQACADWQRHDRAVADLEMRLAAISTRHLR